MDSLADPLLREEIESLIGWWHDAGVDTAIGEQPRKWLEKNTSYQADVSARPSTPVNVAPVPELPRAFPSFETLPAFSAWLATDTLSLDDYPPRRRLPAEGNLASGLMIVADVPERGDADAGRLLTGEAGVLFDRMLDAMKLDRAAIYLTTLAPARPPSGMLTDAEVDRLAPLLRQHVQLAAPKRLWLMGRAASRAILGTDEAEAAGKLHEINYNGVMMNAIATLHPRVLLRDPKSKARAWADMQRLIGDSIA